MYVMVIVVFESACLTFESEFWQLIMLSACSALLIIHVRYCLCFGVLLQLWMIYMYDGTIEHYITLGFTLDLSTPITPLAAHMYMSTKHNYE